ncbi:hypothetical protein XELAEV_18002073mg [Xenopus laevis]|nr:hypothetical protein XELAEV_18002073mg [Xenopus laevis]
MLKNLIEVARLINPVIESTINTAIDKLQLEIGKISQQLGCHDKRFSELESVVSSIYDDSNKMQKNTDQLENKMQDLLLKVDDLENRARRNNLRFVGISVSHKTDSLTKLVSKIIPQKMGISLNTGMKLERTGCDPKEASLFVHQLEHKWLNSSKSIQPIPNSPKLNALPQRNQRDRKQERSPQQTQGPSKEPRRDLGGTQRSRSRSRSPFSSIKISPPPSSEDDMVFES